MLLFAFVTIALLGSNICHADSDSKEKGRHNGVLRAAKGKGFKHNRSIEFLSHEFLSQVKKDLSKIKNRKKTDTSSGGEHQPESLQDTKPYERTPSLEITNGSFVKRGTYPFFTALWTWHDEHQDLKYDCSGSLVSPEFVLTAAHCIRSVVAVEVGAFKIDEKNGGQHSELSLVEKIFVHPDYDKKETENDNDFALLKLESPSTITPIPMDSDGESEDFLSDEKNLWPVGFGKDENGNWPTKLKHVEVKYVSNEDCVWPKTGYKSSKITENMMCTSGESGKDACQGDSGGPLLDRDNGVLVGVVSWGPRECGSDDYPGVYARVSSQYNWIKETICDNSINPPSFCTV